jgi:hypothetical protein
MYTIQHTTVSCGGGARASVSAPSKPSRPQSRGSFRLRLRTHTFPAHSRGFQSLNSADSAGAAEDVSCASGGAPPDSGLPFVPSTRQRRHNTAHAADATHAEHHAVSGDNDAEAREAYDTRQERAAEGAVMTVGLAAVPPFPLHALPPSPCRGPPSPPLGLHGRPRPPGSGPSWLQALGADSGHLVDELAAEASVPFGNPEAARGRAGAGTASGPPSSGAGRYAGMAIESLDEGGCGARGGGAAACQPGACGRGGGWVGGCHHDAGGRGWRVPPAVAHEDPVLQHVRLGGPCGARPGGA